MNIRARIVGFDDEERVLIIKTPEGDYITSVINNPDAPGDYEQLKAQGWVELEPLSQEPPTIN